ncbi:MAG: hypothetical protein MJ224_08260, partial [archaeon]|nr:hypothetical protein [archaeon]
NKKIIKYISRSIFGEGFDSYTKSCADYCLELIYDSENNLISKKIKPNPHKNLSSPYPKGYI